MVQLAIHSVAVLEKRPEERRAIAVLVQQAPEPLDRDRRRRFDLDRRLGGTGKSSSGGGLSPWQVKRVRAFIEDHLADHLSLNTVAVQVRLSPSYFSRTFGRSFGVSFTQYLKRRRVERAQGLMLATQGPLCDIALICGFSDQSHFSRVFLQATGVTPSSWRRQTLGRATPRALVEPSPAA